MALGFIIPASESYVSADTTITPDKGMSRQSKARVRVAKFGDGYEQRIINGIKRAYLPSQIASNKTEKEKDFPAFS